LFRGADNPNLSLTEKKKKFWGETALRPVISAAPACAPRSNRQCASFFVFDLFLPPTNCFLPLALRTRAAGVPS
jgi:hypothetical protein